MRVHRGDAEDAEKKGCQKRKQKLKLRGYQGKATPALDFSILDNQFSRYSLRAPRLCCESNRIGEGVKECRECKCHF
jgi:hypothetical protein